MTKHELRTQLAANTAALRKEDPESVVQMFRKAYENGTAMYGLSKTLSVSYWTVIRWKKLGWNYRDTKRTDTQ